MQSTMKMPMNQPNDPNNQAAIYQNAMQQAATAYHLAANAYETVSGQVAFPYSRNTEQQ